MGVLSVHISITGPFILFWLTAMGLCSSDVACDVLFMFVNERARKPEHAHTPTDFANGRKFLHASSIDREDQRRQPGAVATESRQSMENYRRGMWAILILRIIAVGGMATTTILQGEELELMPSLSHCKNLRVSYYVGYL